MVCLSLTLGYLCEGEDIVSLSLMRLEDVNSSLDQLEGIDHKRYLLEKILLAGALVEPFDIVIKQFLLMSRNDVPCLGLTEVVVIDGV